VHPSSDARCFIKIGFLFFDRYISSEEKGMDDNVTVVDAAREI